MEFLINSLTAAVSGVITGFGVGGGTILILYLALFRDFPQISAQGINLLYFIPCAAVALISHIKNGRIDKKIALFCGISGAVSSFALSFFATGIKGTYLSCAFGYFLIFIGVSEIFRIFSKKKK